MRRPAAMMIRTSFAIAAVAAGLALASLSASAQDYLVDGRAASVAEARYLSLARHGAGQLADQWLGHRTRRQQHHQEDRVR